MPNSSRGNRLWRIDGNAAKNSTILFAKRLASRRGTAQPVGEVTMSHFMEYRSQIPGSRPGPRAVNSVRHDQPTESVIDGKQASYVKYHRSSNAVVRLAGLGTRRRDARQQGSAEQIPTDHVQLPMVCPKYLLRGRNAELPQLERTIQGSTKQWGPMAEKWVEFNNGAYLKKTICRLFHVISKTSALVLSH